MACSRVDEKDGTDVLLSCASKQGRWLLLDHGLIRLSFGFYRRVSSRISSQTRAAPGKSLVVRGQSDLLKYWAVDRHGQNRSFRARISAKTSAAVAPDIPKRSAISGS